MIQIISGSQYEWLDFFSEVIADLEEHSDEIQAIVVTTILNNEEVPAHIDYLNCCPDDIYHIGAMLQKEAIIHEIKEELDLEDAYE